MYYNQIRQQATDLSVPRHTEADEALVEDGHLGPGDVERLVLEEVVLNLVPNFGFVLRKFLIVKIKSVSLIRQSLFKGPALKKK